MSVPVPIHQAVRARAHGRTGGVHIVARRRGSVRRVLPWITEYPRSRGGTDTLENLALACRRCNERRYIFTTGSQSGDAAGGPRIASGAGALGRAFCVDGGWAVDCGDDAHRSGDSWNAWISTTSSATTTAVIRDVAGVVGSRVGGTHRRVILSSQVSGADAVHILPGTKAGPCHRDVCYYAHVSQFRPRVWPLW